MEPSRRVVNCHAAMSAPFRRRLAYLIVLIVAIPVSLYAASPQLTIQIKDYATMPMTGQVDGKGNDASLARVDLIREEPGGNKRRLFVNDINGPLYILDKKSKKFITYLNFNGSNGRPGLFHKLTTSRGNSMGLINFIFDPDYEHNGKFYTIHIEDPALPGSSIPDNTNFPGLNIKNYTVSPPIHAPGPAKLEAVLIEWTDTNIANSTFEGTARELMRLQLATESHPMGGLIFNPTAKPGTPDWRVLYISCGDSRAGESMDAALRQIRSGSIRWGKILQIIPDLKATIKIPVLSARTASIVYQTTILLFPYRVRVKKSGQTAYATRNI